LPVPSFCCTVTVKLSPVAARDGVPLSSSSGSLPFVYAHRTLSPGWTCSWQPPTLAAIPFR